MEVFSLLKYWRGGGATRDIRTETTGATTIAATTDDDGDDAFFDLEFSLPDEEDDEERENDTDSDGENDREFDFTISSGDRTDLNASLSPSDDLFFKGQLVPIEQEPNSKPQFSLFKSVTKIRVLNLKLKKRKANAAEKVDQKHQEPQQKPNQLQSKLFTVKLKVEEVPIMSLFTRDQSSRASSASNNEPQKQQSSDKIHESPSDEKRFSKDVMQKYLKMVKPLYVRVSKRYAEKLRFSGQLRPPKSPDPSAEEGGSEQTLVAVGDVKSEKQGKLPARLRVVCKQLGKSRSAVVAVAPSGSVQGRRRDDSLLQQQDGIQGAILHCKRSFNASRDSESSLLSRSVSDPLATNPCT